MANVLGWFDPSLPTPGNASWQNIRISRRGELRVIDFWTQMAIDGRCFQIRAGTIASPATADVVLTDQNCEMCVDAASGLTVIPGNLEVTYAAAAGTLSTIAVKSVGSPSTGGTAFTPLNVNLGGSAASSTARVQTAGNVTVPAETATTTRRHYEQILIAAAGAGNDVLSPNSTNLWQPKIPPVIQGSASGSCLYLQVAGTGTAQTYYAHIDYVELATASL